MILSNVEIKKAIDEGRLIISPEPQARDYDTTAVNLHLAAGMSIPRGGSFVYDLTKPGFAGTLARNSDRIEIPATGYPLEPKNFILGITTERVGLPLIQGKTLAARIEGKSSVARCGLLVHFTAPTVHAGWDGPLVLEIINLGVSDFMLRPGMAICQLILEVVYGDPEANPSQFQFQTTPAGTSKQ
jgi:dCTP deaminase